MVVGSIWRPLIFISSWDINKITKPQFALTTRFFFRDQLFLVESQPLACRCLCVLKKCLNSDPIL